jgi:hypothetical protein
MSLSPKDLAERESKPIAMRWIDAALAELRAHAASFGEPGQRGSTLARSALAINFAVRSREDAKAYLPHIVATLRRARRVLSSSERYFHNVTAAKARAVFGQDIPPAYATYAGGVYFTPAFAQYNSRKRTGIGPMCRAAMVLHESVHVIDSLSGVPSVHISEWDEPRFSSQTIEESLHNPSSYASLGAQIFTRSLRWPPSLRFGAGRLAQ